MTGTTLSRAPRALLTLVVVAAIGAGCSEAPAAVATATTAPGLRIASPVPGATVSISPVTVIGTAPAGTTVVRDISLAPDQDATADSRGNWSMSVDLQLGANDLVFRIGNDTSTAVHLDVTYTPETAQQSPPATPTSPPQSQPTQAPTAPPTQAPTPVPPKPTPTPTPPPSYRTFDDGTFAVGTEIKAGTYRIREPADFCYWARLKGFDGSLGEILANEDLYGAYGVVTIKSTDAGFESDGCGEWTTDLSRVTDSKTRLDVDGTYIVGTDLTAGQWKSSGGADCYWARLSAFTGTTSAILANGLPSGQTIVTIRSTDKGFETNGCGTWTRL